MPRARGGHLACLLLLAIVFDATAQGGDPTRPPAAFYADPAASAAAAPLTPPRLQSLRVGPGLKSAAVIDGRLVHVGDRLPSAWQVIAITADAVQLRAVKGAAHWLHLAADIKKSPSGMEKKK